MGLDTVTVTLDQLRTLLAVADAGSFSAAGRRLRRAQSAVSYAMAGLEQQLGVVLWDRATRIPTLTSHGRAILAKATRVCREADELVALASALAGGLESSVSLCVDALFPLPVLVELCREFALQFPAVDLRIDTRTLSAVSARVLEGAATIGVVSPPGIMPGLETLTLASVRLVPVAHPGHPLAKHKGPLRNADLSAHVQIVLSEGVDTGVPDQGVVSARTWRVADLNTKRALLRDGLGWGSMPLHDVADDIAAKRLLPLVTTAFGEEGMLLELVAVFRPTTVFGPAHHWLLERMERLCRRYGARAKQTRRRGARLPDSKD